MEKQPSNRAENQIRPFTVGRKNWLFSELIQENFV